MLNILFDERIFYLLNKKHSHLVSRLLFEKSVNVDNVYLTSTELQCFLKNHTETIWPCQFLSALLNIYSTICITMQQLILNNDIILSMIINWYLNGLKIMLLQNTSMHFNLLIELINACENKNILK